MYGRNGGEEEQPDEQGWIGEDKLLLRVQGVDGKCGIKGWEDCIDVMSFSWNLSRQVPEARLPSRIRLAQSAFQRAEDKKLRAEMGLPEEQAEEDEKKKKNGDKEPAAAAAAPAVALGSSSASAAAAELVEPELNFSDSEVEPRTTSTLLKPHIGTFTLTKFNDWSSPQLYQLALSQKRGIEISFQLVRERVKSYVPKVLTKEEQAAAAAKAEKQAEKKQHMGMFRGFGFQGGAEEEAEEETEEAKAVAAAKAAEPPLEKEFVIKQQWVLLEAFLTNVSISGGAGGQPVETLSVSFESFQYKFVNHPRAERGGRGGRRGGRAAPAAAEDGAAGSSGGSAPPKVAEMSIIYDGLRQVVHPYETAVRAELNKSDQLRPSASVVLEYI